MTAIPPEPPVSRIFRDGKHLVVLSGSILPEVCPATGEDLPRGPENGRRPTEIGWVQPGAYLALLAGLVIGLILILLMRKKGLLTYGLSATAQRRTRNFRIVGTVFLLGIVPCALKLSNSENSGWYAVAALLLLLTALGIFIFAEPFRVTGFRQPGWFRLSGCAPAFLDRFEQADFEKFR